jgi:hypothetical protein
MDQAYYAWIGLLAAGCVVGFFVKPSTVGITGAVVMAVDIAGLVVASLLEKETLVWVFGIGGMAIPIVFAMLVAGAFAGATIKRFLQQRSGK